MIKVGADARGSNRQQSARHITLPSSRNNQDAATPSLTSHHSEVAANTVVAGEG